MSNQLVYKKIAEERKVWASHAQAKLNDILSDENASRLKIINELSLAELKRLETFVQRIISVREIQLKIDTQL